MQLRTTVILGWLASASIHEASFAFANEAPSNSNGNLRQLEASHQGEEGDINCTLIKLPTQYKDNKVPLGRQKEEFVCQTGDGIVRSTKGVEQLLARLGANDIPSGETQLKKGKLVGNQVVATNDSTIEQEEGEGEVAGAQGLNCRNGKNCTGRGRKLTGTSVERSVLVLRVTAPDSEVTVSSDTIADSVFGSLVGGSDEINLASQYDKCSNGKLLFAPVTGSNIVSGVAEVSIDVDATEASKYDLMNAAWAEADSLGLPIHTTDNIIICLPPGSETGDAAGWVAYAYTNGRRSVYNNEWCTSVSAQMHEVGHNLYLRHSNHGETNYDDQTGMMGYSYVQSEWPRMCFNAAKLSQLGWYHDMEAVVMPSAGQTFSGKVIGSTDYQAAQQSTEAYNVLVEIVGSNGDDYYLTYNRAEDYNQDTIELADELVLVKGGLQIESNLIAGITEGISHVILNYDDSGRDLHLKVVRSGNDGSIDFMKLHIGLSCESDAECRDADAASGDETCHAGYCHTSDYVVPVAGCGNGVCEANEDCRSCPYDCTNHCGVLPTTMVDNNGSAGNMFNVEAKQDVSITGFDVHIRYPVETTVKVWTREGTYLGVEAAGSEWTVLQEVVVESEGQGKTTELPKLPQPVTVLAGSQQAFYVTVLNGRNRYTKGFEEGAVYAEDDYLQFFEGVGKSLPAFGSTFRSGGSRIFNGGIRYSPISTVVQSDIKLRFTESSGGMETSWELREHPGSVVLQSGGLYSGNEQVNESLPVTSNSCYDLTVYDASGDGIDGGYALDVDGVDVSSEFPFADQETIFFGNWETTLSNVLETTYAAGTGSFGNMFDIEALENIEITSIDIHTRLTVPIQVKVYTKGGTMLGNNKDPPAWTEAQDVILVGQGSGKITSLPPFNNPVRVAAGMTQAFYVTQTKSGIRYTKGTQLDAPFVSNAHLIVKEGYGVKYPFGRNYSPRVFNGRLNYNVLGCEAQALASAVHFIDTTVTYGAGVGGIENLEPLALENDGLDDGDDEDYRDDSSSSDSDSSKKFHKKKNKNSSSSSDDSESKDKKATKDKKKKKKKKEQKSASW